MRNLDSVSEIEIEIDSNWNMANKTQEWIFNFI